MRQKYIDRHRRRHGERPAGDRALRDLQRVLRRVFNIREGRAPYHVIRKRFVNGARLTGTHLCILIVAMVIACIGLDTDSDIAIVGAMLICPLMGSVLATAYGIATLDRSLTRDALSGLALQMVFCLVTSTIYFAVSPTSGMTPALADNSSPTAWDLLLALVGGFAGALGNSRDQEPSTVIAGVAVATALMPPLCAAGYGLAATQMGLAITALYEFGINVVFIATSAVMVLLLLRAPLKRDLNDDGIVSEIEDRIVQAESRNIRRLILLGTSIFAIPCIMLTANALARANEEQAAGAADYYSVAETSQELAVVCPGFESYSVGTKATASGRNGDEASHLVAHVVTSEALSTEQQKAAEGLITLDVPEVDRVEFSVE